MTFLQFFQSLSRNAQPATVNTTLECPNCWGIQQWENEDKAPRFEFDKDSTLIGKSRKGFIQRFADRHVTGIRKSRRM